VTAKGNDSNTVLGTTRKFGFNAFTLGSDTIRCGGKAISGSVFGLPRVRRVVL
jgi:hypothetical protein